MATGEAMFLAITLRHPGSGKMHVDECYQYSVLEAKAHLQNTLFLREIIGRILEPARPSSVFTLVPQLLRAIASSNENSVF